MAWTTPVDYSTGQVITAAIWNDLIGAGGNIDETAPAKVTTAGDLIYGTGANAISRLGVGSAANQLLKVNSGATAPEWGAVAATEITAANWKLFYSNGSGAVQELAAGASGTVLTANGASAAPTFEAAAAGGSISAVATGAISGAGISVSLNSDGTVSTTADGRSAASISAFSDITANVGNYTTKYPVGIYDDNADAVVVAWEDNVDSSGTWNNYKFKTAAASISGTTLTFGTVVDISTYVGSPSTYGIGYDAVLNKVWYAWHNNNGDQNAYLATATVSGNTITVGASATATGWADSTGTDQNSAQFAYDTDTNQMIFMYGGYYVPKLWLAVVSESGGTITVNTALEVTTTNFVVAVQAVYMAGPSRLATLGGSGATRTLATYSISGTTITADQQDTFTGHGNDGQYQEKNFMMPTSDASKLLYGNLYYSTGNNIEYNIFTVTAGAATTRAYTAGLHLTAQGTVQYFTCDRIGTTGDYFAIQSTYNNFYTCGTYQLENISSSSPTMALLGND